MDTFFTVIAVTSLIVSAFPNLISAIKIISYLTRPSAYTIKINWQLYFWLAMFVWPITYFIVK